LLRLIESCEVFVLARFYIDLSTALSEGLVCALPEGVSRHIQVLRMQPGGQVQLFDGSGNEWLATVTEMGRKVVTVAIASKLSTDRELPVRVTLAMGMPTNDRMDTLIEKAAELGVQAIQPLMCERSVLRLDGERAAKKVAHWQAVAVAACEQSGRAVVPQVLAVQSLGTWLRSQTELVAGGPQDNAVIWRGVLSLREAVPVSAWLARADGTTAQETRTSPSFVFLSGPEGGLSPSEEQAALDAGWTAVSLGKRVLRADTAPLAVLSVIGARYEA
jgi:16S rRNA (uracil1498-N3)-methyltransferase